MDGLHSFSGGPLCGDNLVRILYLDESGIGKIAKDPCLVVAGVLINGDKQWAPLKARLKSLLEGAVPSGEPTPKFLHAVDIFHGSGEFPRVCWTEKVRHELLDEIAKVPVRFQVPVMWGLADRARYAREKPTDTPRQHLRECYASATLQCFFQVEWYMRNRVGPGELASITIEENSDLQKKIKDIFRYACTYEALEKTNSRGLAIGELLPITRVIDEPSFQEKAAASILQLADFCAFALKRASGHQLHYERFAKPFAHATLLWCPGKVPPITSPPWS